MQLPRLSCRHQLTAHTRRAASLVPATTASVHEPP
jgi:hypothetical protein